MFNFGPYFLILDLYSITDFRRNTRMCAPKFNNLSFYIFKNPIFSRNSTNIHPVILNVIIQHISPLDVSLDSSSRYIQYIKNDTYLFSMCQFSTRYSSHQCSTCITQITSLSCVVNLVIRILQVFNYCFINIMCMAFPIINTQQL